MNKRGAAAGTAAIILNSLCFFADFLVFVPLLYEEITLGFGFGTQIEMLALVVWSVNILTVLPILAGIVLSIISTVKKDATWKIALNFSLISATLIEIFLSTLFMFV